MKPDDVSQEIEAMIEKALGWLGGDSTSMASAKELIFDAIMAAKAEEREACANIAYREAEKARRNQCAPQSLGCLWVYDAIRSRT